MTGDLSFNGLLVVALIAVAAPLVARVLPVKVPGVVLEILAGIIVGPAVLDWVQIDAPITVLALVGLAFLLFLAGLEIDLTMLRGDVLRLTLIGFALTLLLGAVVGFGVDAAGWTSSPFFIAIALSATSLGLVIPVLKDAGAAESPLGQYTIAGATIADFAAVILLSLFFSGSEGGTTSKLVTLAMFVGVVAAIGLGLGRVSRSRRIEATLVALQDTTAEIRVRIAVALLIGLVALAASAGLEIILGAFIAGALLGLLDRDSASHPHFRLKLDAIGYGLLVPVFFVSSGLRFDLDALVENPSALARVPVFLGALALAWGVPAMVYRRVIGTEGARIAGLLQATSLPFIVTAAEIGVSIDAIAPVTAAALVTAGLLSVVLFPPVALGRLRHHTATTPARHADDPTPVVHRPMGTQF